jgi:hypothetical protein
MIMDVVVLWTDLGICDCVVILVVDTGVLCFTCTWYCFLEGCFQGPQIPFCRYYVGIRYVSSLTSRVNDGRPTWILATDRCCVCVCVCLHVARWVADCLLFAR